MITTWLDRLLLGKEAVERGQEAESRLRQADRIREVLDAEETRQLGRLESEARATRQLAELSRADSCRPLRHPSLPEIELEVS